ncbi:hypothetical protein FDB15_09735 [Clostridium botulinum]|nr:hypothetical protein [Clostridium botulinum]NFI02582.1 hypothetical protein [Clostridium botulinum]NFI65003.1 hypothetical protein [Clostridium botulinum]NFJ45495.1 hypothetical protein [Clostridium botulinum]NFJ49131.1 hypothetical protein [Clostridium botulinum]
MKVQILMKSGNTYIQEMDKAKDIQDVYVQLHLDFDGLMVLDDNTIINPTEVAEVTIINKEDSRANVVNIEGVTVNTKAHVDIDEVAKELTERLKSFSDERICDSLSW